MMDNLILHPTMGKYCTTESFTTLVTYSKERLFKKNEMSFWKRCEKYATLLCSCIKFVQYFLTDHQAMFRRSRDMTSNTQRVCHLCLEPQTKEMIKKAGEEEDGEGRQIIMESG